MYVMLLGIAVGSSLQRSVPGLVAIKMAKIRARVEIPRMMAVVRGRMVVILAGVSSRI
jgi:hypothetical protein